MSNTTNKASRRETRAAASEYIYNLTGQPFPNSHKVYVEGTQPGVRVGMREITLSDTFIGGTDENPVYESGFGPGPASASSGEENPERERQILIPIQPSHLLTCPTMKLTG